MLVFRNSLFGPFWMFFSTVDIGLRAYMSKVFGPILGISNSVETIVLHRNSIVSSNSVVANHKDCHVTHVIIEVEIQKI